MSICENCEQSHSGNYGSGRFCCAKCARGFSTKNKRSEINKRVSKTLTGKKLVPYTTKPCQHCGEEITFISRRKLNFCSPGCSAKFRAVSDPDGLARYRSRAAFTFDVEDYPEHFDLELVEKFGWYSPSNKGNNLDGVSKDHMFSVKEGFLQGVDPKIIAHPANCQLMQQSENSKKKSSCSITLEELYEKISNF